MIGDETIPIAVASIMSPMHWPTNRERYENWDSIKPLLLDGTKDEWITDQHQFYVASVWNSEASDYLLFEHHH